MLIGGVAQHQVHDDVDIAFVRLAEQAVEILQVAIFRINGVIVGYIVAKIVIRGGIYRREPDPVDAQVLQIIQVLNDTCQIPDPIRIRILERARVDLVNNPVFPPKLVCSHQILLFGKVVEVFRISLCSYSTLCERHYWQLNRTFRIVSCRLKTRISNQISSCKRSYSICTEKSSLTNKTGCANIS